MRPLCPRPLNLGAWQLRSRSVLRPSSSSACYLAAPDDPERRPLVVNLINAVAWFMGGVVLLSMREGKVARSSRAIGLTLLIGSGGHRSRLRVGAHGTRAAKPGFADVLFLLPLITLVAGFRSEIRHHVPTGDRRELATDTALIVSAVMAAGYVLIRPHDASSSVSASAVTFALLSAFLIATYPALAIWVPTRAHVARAVVFAGLGTADPDVRMAMDPTDARHERGDRAGDRPLAARRGRHVPR